MRAAPMPSSCACRRPTPGMPTCRTSATSRCTRSARSGTSSRSTRPWSPASQPSPPWRAPGIARKTPSAPSRMPSGGSRSSGADSHPRTTFVREDPAVTRSGAPVRLSELVATLSLVSDLGMGRPMERVLRQTVITLRLADAAGLGDPVRSAAFYTSLLTWVGCAADTSELAQLFGDEAELYADTHDGDLGGVSMAVFVARHLGNGSSGLRRVGMVGRFLATAGRSVQRVMEGHCQSASDLAERLDLGEEVSRPLLQAFERWDGRGVPGQVAGDELAPAMRLVHLADNIEAFHHSSGTEAALAVVRGRRGTQFDPGLADCFVERHAEILAGLDSIRAWDEVIALDPRLGAVLADDRLDLALQAFADFADLK